MDSAERDARLSTWHRAVERSRRVLRMVDQMDHEGFGMCSNEGECQAVCPKEISIASIARMTREYVRAQLARD